MATPTDPERPTLGQILDLCLRRIYPPDIYGPHPDYWTEHLVRQVAWLLHYSSMNWKERFCRDALINRRELRHVIKAEAERPGEDRKMAGFRYDQYDETMAAFNKVTLALGELYDLLRSDRYPRT